MDVGGPPGGTPLLLLMLPLASTASRLIRFEDNEVVALFTGVVDGRLVVVALGKEGFVGRAGVPTGLPLVLLLPDAIIDGGGGSAIAGRSTVIGKPVNGGNPPNCC